MNEVAILLDASEYEGHADYVRRLIVLAARSPQSFRDALVSIDMWGGSGAVWDVWPFRSIEDGKRFLRLLVALTEEMAVVGIPYARADEIAAAFRYWLETDVWAQIAAVGPAPPVERPRANYIKRYLETQPRGDRRARHDDSPRADNGHRANNGADNERADNGAGADNGDT